MSDDRITADTARRAFLWRSLVTAGALVAGAPLLRSVRAASPGPTGVPAGTASPESGMSPSRGSTAAAKVLEAWYVGLRDEKGAIQRQFLEDAILGLAQVYSNDFPLDALAEFFPGEPPVSIRVDARSGRAETTTVLTTRLAEALRDMGAKGDAIVVGDVSDADLTAGGYRVAREGEGPLCHGDDPRPGYGDPRDLPGVGKKIRLERSLDDKERRIAVLARLHARGGRMGPFVLDAALRAFDDTTRKKAMEDPEMGARLLASPLFGERVGLVIGDLIAIELGKGEAAAASPGEPRSAEGRSADVWNADELLAGPNLFAVERIGHTVLSNTCKARGLGTISEPPLLAAATTLGLPGARLSTIAWTKAVV